MSKAFSTQTNETYDQDGFQITFANGCTISVVFVTDLLRNISPPSSPDEYVVSRLPHLALYIAFGLFGQKPPMNREFIIMDSAGLPA